MRRWVKVSVAAAVFLGVGGYVAEPYAQDWRLARSACDGALPPDAVEQLTPDDAHLRKETSRLHEGLGSYSCRLTADGGIRDDGRLVVGMEAYTRRDDRDREFMTMFPEEGFPPQAPLPEGLPGFIDRHSTISLVLPCPGLGKDTDGRQRKLLVRVSMGRDAKSGVPGAAYRTAVALANGASERLGCGAEPLKAPAGGAVPADPEGDAETVPLSESKGTSCGWMAGAGLPQDQGLRVAAGVNDAAPTGRCDLTDRDGKPEVSLVAWYGDWSNRLTSEDGVRHSRTATARCDGEAANFALGGSDDIPGVGEAVQRRLLKEFAEDQVRRRGCSDLRFF
ncbi:hypothetical protein AMK26_19405 [Streptomyces sp. CB03234]|uniref:hypothetical protein n=1 Tax=Streptomyces sp. (strain CB03234) TaxID=1703937 RepID=UPI00093C6F0B|nr:hypothetical protein [Streptomyces sp. CB03234]OKK03624.1 hypothetical protein AMK26_19405 [Streptomyces sp. CB03234]